MAKKSIEQKVKGWKDITLLRRLKQFGYEPYIPKNQKKIRKGESHIPEKRRQELEKKYLNLIKKDALFEGWITLGKWLDRVSKTLKGLKISDSYFRLHTHAGINFVYVKGNQVAFANKDNSTPPVQNEVSPQYVVYAIHLLMEIDDEEDDKVIQEHETWLQASEQFYFGVNPFGVEEVTKAKAAVTQMEINNQSEKEKLSKSQFSYNWWDMATNVNYMYIGIGVVL